MDTRSYILRGLGVLLILGLLCTFGIRPGASAVYRWVDPQGRVWYSDTRRALPPRPTPPPSAACPVTVDRDQTVVASPVGVTVPLRSAGRAFLVEVGLHDHHHLPFVLDTGADATVLTASVARMLGLDLRCATRQRVRTVSGVADAHRLLLPMLAVGAARVAPVEVFVVEYAGNRPEAGFLGMSFLRHFTITVDPAAPSLTLRPLAVAPQD